MGKATSHDAACVSQILRGDVEAAEGLVERVRPLVTAIVRRRLPRRTEEADLVQMVFLRVFTKLDQYAGRVPLEHWVSRIAINTCLNEMRRERSRPELRRADLSAEQDEILDHLDEGQEKWQPHQQVAARELVEQILQRLPRRENLIIAMLYLEGLSLQEIHESTGWSVMAIKLLAFRARKRMQKTLKHLLQERFP